MEIRETNTCQPWWYSGTWRLHARVRISVVKFFLKKPVTRAALVRISDIYFNFRLNRNKQKTHPNSLKESIFWYLGYLGLFRFVMKQICLFRLFRYRFETPKQTEIFCFWFHKTNRNKPKQTQNRSCFGLFRFEPKFIFVCFEDTL